MATDETVRYTMRTNAVQDGIWRRAKCLVHTDCRLCGRMVQPSGRRVDLKSKTGDIKDLNANFVKHLEKRDKADGTSHADTWRKGLIHGPQAHFTVPYDPKGAGDAGDGGGADGAVDTGETRKTTARSPSHWRPRARPRRRWPTCLRPPGTRYAADGLRRARRASCARWPRSPRARAPRRASGLGAGVQVFLKRDLAPD